MCNKVETMKMETNSMTNGIVKGVYCCNFELFRSSPIAIKKQKTTMPYINMTGL